MKKISLNECGSGFRWMGPVFGCGSGEFYFNGSRKGLPKYGIAYGDEDKVISKIKSDEEKTMKQLYNQSHIRVITSNLTSAKWNIELFIDYATEEIKDIKKIEKSIKNKEKKMLAKQIISELENKIEFAKKAYEFLKDFKTVKIPITFEKGNKVFII